MVVKEYFLMMEVDDCKKLYKLYNIVCVKFFKYMKGDFFLV